MNAFESELDSRLADLRAAGLHRALRRIDSAQGRQIEMNGRRFLNFSSNDYLGLANHPALKEAAIKATETFGAGSGASRLICGSLRPHHDLEESIADFKGCERALSFSSGYATATGTIGALVGKEDIIILDKLVHACIVDAARLSGAKMRVFAHNDLESLAEILAWSDRQKQGETAARRPNVLVVTESVFSMDGDFAPLKEMVELKERHGAWLMVDEAHAMGLFGENRRGLVEQSGISGRVEIQMGTMGKALGSSGGFVAGSTQLVEYLVNRARSFIFSTAPSPASSAAATAAIKLVRSAEGEERRAKLMALVEFASKSLHSIHGGSSTLNSPIIPLIIGDEQKAVGIYEQLMDQGFFIPAIRFPSVAKGSARLRLTLSASQSMEDLVKLIRALQVLLSENSNLILESGKPGS